MEKQLEGGTEEPTVEAMHSLLLKICEDALVSDVTEGGIRTRTYVFTERTTGTAPTDLKGGCGGSHRAPSTLLIPVGKRKTIDWTPETLKKMEAEETIPYGTNIFLPLHHTDALAERPERSLSDLIGKTVSRAVYREDGPHGPGLYADCWFAVPADSALAMRWTQESRGFLCRGFGNIRVNGQVINFLQPFKKVTSLEMFE